MRPDARVASAIEIVDQWLASDRGLDRILTQWARNNRYAGSGDRAAIADLVYGAVRCLRSANWVSGNAQRLLGRNVMHGYLLLEQTDPSDLFTGGLHAPGAITDGEASARRTIEASPRPVRLDYPDWLDSHLAGIEDEDLHALRTRAPLDLRVNSLKATPDAAIDTLAKDGISVSTVTGVPMALRVVEGARKVARSEAFTSGLIEIQDAGSQALASLAAPKPEELIIDLCAGGGGKSLAMAADSGGQARIVAHDIAADRMRDLPERASRSGASIEVVTPGSLGKYRNRVDLVFIDAPCSGSGAWRRNPDAKWRFTPERLDALARTQAELLEQAVSLCNPSGRIVYGTCSLLDAENIAQVETFVSSHAGWHIRNQFASVPSQGMDGFFGAVLSQALDSRYD